MEAVNQQKLNQIGYSLAILGSCLAVSLGISEETFMASWQWLKNFRTRRGMNLHGEGAEVDKTDPKHLKELDILYETIAKH